MKLGIIGTGNMAEALLAGIKNNRLFKPQAICGTDIDTKRLKKISKHYGIKPVSSINAVVDFSDIILLAVKPQDMPQVLSVLKLSLQSKHLLISIAAGLDTAYFQKYLSEQIRLVRAMPNTTALIGLGATVYYCNSYCKTPDRKWAQKIFKAIGIAHEIKKESQLDAVTALSGSGPAYVYVFIHSLVCGAKQCGLDASLALKLAIQTVLGSSQLLKNSKEDFKTLISKVASKGGTTEAGLNVLHEKKWAEILGHGVQAACKRAQKLRTNTKW